MYDTVIMTLTQAQAGGMDLTAAARVLDGVMIHRPAAGGIESYTGRLGSLLIWLDGYNIKITGGSICKWFLGDNYQTLSRGDMERAIEKLADTLHLPMMNATITRADFGRVFVMQHPAEVYFNHLGQLSRYDRLEEPSGLYYRQRDERLCFYDKNREQREKGETPPAFYNDKNVLRYEQRYLRHLQRKWGEITAARLYDEEFYINLYHKWVKCYRDIKKINCIHFNFEDMTGKKEAYRLGILSLIEKAGGLLNILSDIEERRAAGKITRRQACELRKLFNEACTNSDGQTPRDEVIEELDKKMAEAARYYR